MANIRNNSQNNISNLTSSNYLTSSNSSLLNDQNRQNKQQDNQSNQNSNQQNNQNNRNNENQANNNSDNNNSQDNETRINNQNSRIKILISEVLIDGGAANDEFIELYNPNNFEVDLSNWKIIKFNKNNNQQTLIGSRTRNTFNNKIIRKFSYLLIANERGSYANIADLVYAESYNLAKDNAVMLVNQNNEIIDLVGWGESPRYEGNLFSQNPPQGFSLVRKAGFESTNQSMVSNEVNFGNSLDTDNNNFDFVLLNPEP